MLDSTGVVPLCSADINGLGSDGPRLGKADNGSVNLTVCGIEACKICDTNDLCGVVAGVGVLIVLVYELDIVDAECVNALLCTVILEGGGSRPLNISGGDNLLLDNNGNGIGGNGLSDKTLGNGYYAVVPATVGNIDNLEGIGGAKCDVAVCVNLIPLVGVGSADGVSNNLNEGGSAIVYLVYISTYSNGEVLINNSRENNITVGHGGNEVAVLVNPSDDILTVDGGNGSEELYVLAFNTSRKEALTNKLTVYGVLNAIDFLKAYREVNRCGDGISVKEGSKDGTVLRRNLGQSSLDINGVSSLVGEYAVCIVEIHESLVTKACGDLIYNAVDIRLCKVEVGLILLYLRNDLLVGKVGEVNILLDSVLVKHALKVNSLKELDKLIECEVIVVSNEAVNIGGASLEHLCLNLIGDCIGAASLKHRLMEHLGNGDRNGVYAVYDADVNVIGNDSGNLTDSIISATRNSGEGEVVGAVIGNDGEVIGELHLVICHVLDFGGHGKLENEILDCGGVKGIVAVFAKRAVYLNAVHINLVDIINEILGCELDALSNLDIILKLIECDGLKSIVDLLCEVLDLLLGYIEKCINVGSQSNGEIRRSSIVLYGAPTGINATGLGGERRSDAAVSGASGKHGGCHNAEEHRKNDKHRQNGTKCLFHFVTNLSKYYAK